MWVTDWWSYPSAYNVLTYVKGLINQTRRPPGRLREGVWGDGDPPVKKNLNLFGAVQTLPGGASQDFHCSMIPCDGVFQDPHVNKMFSWVLFEICLGSSQDLFAYTLSRTAPFQCTAAHPCVLKYALSMDELSVCVLSFRCRTLDQGFRWHTCPTGFMICFLHTPFCMYRCVSQLQRYYSCTSFLDVRSLYFQFLELGAWHLEPDRTQR